MNGDIELEIGAGEQPGAFRVQVLHSVGGGLPQGRLVLDADAILNQRDELERTVLSSAVPRRGIVSAAEQPLREVGRQLFEALFTGPVYGAYRASLGAVQQRGGRLRVVLRLTAPQLAALPWETMFDPETGAYLCRTEPLVRRVEAPYTPDPLQVDPPLRILGVVAAPRGLPALDVEAEQQHLEVALARPLAAGLVELTWAPDASWETIHDLMLEGTWHILHFVGHGDYDADNDEGVLALVGAGGRADRVEASRLTDLLSEANPTPRLVVLNSCSSGEAGAHDLFSSTAAALVHRGISAAAAMQFAISDAAAIKFARGFYAAIARGRGVDEAMRSGRIEILGTARTLEWVTPVLYVRGGVTQLFSLVSPVTRPAPPPSQATTRSGQATAHAMYIEARAEIQRQRYDAAVDLLGELLALDPGHYEAAELLKQAQNGKQVADAYARARGAEDAGDWDTAVSEYDRVLEADQSYQDARRRREDCVRQQRIADLRAELRQRYSAGEWQAVVAVDAELASLDPAAADPGGLATRAREELREAAGSRLERVDAPAASRRAPQILGISPALLDKVSATDTVIVGDTAYALRSPRPDAVELVRLDLSSAQVTDRIEVPGGWLIAASSGGVVLTDQETITVYDPQLRPTGRWDGVPGWQVRHVVATQQCGWGLASGPAKKVQPKWSSGMQLEARLVRINFATGAVKAYPPYSDMYWKDPSVFRGLQLMNACDKGGAEVAALRCEWTSSGMTVVKRKIVTFAREDSDEVRSYPVGITTWAAPGPDPRQVLRWNDLTLLGYWAVRGTKSRVALSRVDGQFESPTLLREFEGASTWWIPAPGAPVVLAPTGDDPVRMGVWRLTGDGRELQHCSTMAGDVKANVLNLYGLRREVRILAAAEADRLWWSVSQPKGLACLDIRNTVTRIDYPDDLYVVGAGEGCIYVLVDRGTGENELRAIQVG